MKKNDQAFPVGYNGHLGMTLRDYFAAKAMQGILAGSGEEDGFVRYDADALAEQVYVMADAMLEARKK
jgi:hypothetical protein